MIFPQGDDFELPLPKRDISDAELNRRLARVAQYADQSRKVAREFNAAAHLALDGVGDSPQGLGLRIKGAIFTVLERVAKTLSPSGKSQKRGIANHTYMKRDKNNT